MTSWHIQYDELRAQGRPMALRVTADLGPERQPGASKPRSASRVDALVRLDVQRLRRRRAEGRFVWSGNRITLS